jgi:hypothetical protein
MNIKTLLSAAVMLLGATFNGQAQTVNSNGTNFFVKGTMKITYAARSNPKEWALTNTYKLNINVANSAVFYGDIFEIPFKDGWTSDQPGKLVYNLKCAVVNPRNTAQIVDVGGLTGVVPVSENNVYNFDQGILKLVVLGRGNASGFESKFTGMALGKPPATKQGVLSKITKEVLTIGQSNKGKVVTTQVKNYDKMEFINHKLAAGPVGKYPDAVVSGVMVYDYDRYVWYFVNLTLSYGWEGKAVQDRISGNIQWKEQPVKGGIREGEYIFDVRINEPPINEAALFAAPSSEEDFFTVDTGSNALVGGIKYRDQMQDGSPVVSDAVIDVRGQGNEVTPQRGMHITKMLLLSSVVPFNAE